VLKSPPFPGKHKVKEKSKNATSQPVKSGFGAVSSRLCNLRRVGTRQSEKGWYTQIVSPSPDEYSMPGVHDVSSTRSLGRPGNEIEILCHLSGFTKAGQNTRTGETFTITRNTLRIVEE